MTEQLEAEAEMFPRKVGERLADARKAAGLDLADIASRTRIPQRHLEAIEQGRYGDLPAVTYCTGFAKAYARVVGLDEVALGRDLRAELAELGGVTREPQYFEPADPARVAPRGLAWTAAALAILLIAGYVVFRAGLLDGVNGRDPLAVAAGTDAPVAEQAGAPELAAANRAAPAAAPAPTSGPVVLTALQNVWLRIYDADGKRLFEKEMQVGETYQVPADANNPQILTGRPDALRVTVGGREVAPLGPPEKTISDVGVSAAALAARLAAPASAVPPAPASGQPPAGAAQP